MSADALCFLYRDARGADSEVALQDWSEVGHYLKGRVGGQPRTYRKDRVLSYRNGGAELLGDPHPAPPTIKTSQHKDRRPEILFTAFAADLRADLEYKASQAGLKVVKNPTKKLAFLCCGTERHSPSKIEAARASGSYIFGQAEFDALIETGELPDEPSLFL